MKTLADYVKLLLPSAITLFNGFLGFYAIFLSFAGIFYVAAFCLILAALCDLLDGRAARYFNASFSIGKELDSFCDFLSFGLAPAFLTLNIYTQAFSLTSLQILLIIIAGFIYVACAAFRLAIFNAEIPFFMLKREKSSNFVGVPSTFCGLSIAFLVLYPSLPTGLYNVIEPSSSQYALFIMLSMIGLSALMLTPINYPKFLGTPLVLTSPKSIAMNLLFVAGAILVGRFLVIIYIIGYIIAPFWRMCIRKLYCKHET